MANIMNIKTPIDETPNTIYLKPRNLKAGLKVFLLPLMELVDTCFRQAENDEVNS